MKRDDEGELPGSEWSREDLEASLAVVIASRQALEYSFNPRFSTLLQIKALEKEETTLRQWLDALPETGDTGSINP